MFENNGCCPPPQKKDDCCCKDGILCALDFFYQDFLVATAGGSCIIPGTLKYYQVLPSVTVPAVKSIPNTIWGIPYIAQDIVPVFPYSGNKDDVSYLNTCKINGFEFQIDTAKCSYKTMDDRITNSFTKIRYTSYKGCCCKNGLIEYLLKAKDFLLSTSSKNTVYISTPYNTFTTTQILAINKDTVWCKNEISTATPTTTYYVISLCEIIGITFDKNPLITSQT